MEQTVTRRGWIAKLHGTAFVVTWDRSKINGAGVPGENSENEEGLFGNDGNKEGERGP